MFDRHMAPETERPRKHAAFHYGSPLAADKEAATLPGVQQITIQIEQYIKGVPSGHYSTTTYLQHKIHVYVCV